MKSMSKLDLWIVASFMPNAAPMRLTVIAARSAISPYLTALVHLVYC